MNRSKKSPQKLRDTARYVFQAFGVLFGIIAFLFILAWILFVFVIYPTAHVSAERASCQNSLKQIGLVLQLYREAHGGIWPETLPELYPEYLTDLHVLICPSSENEVGPAKDAASWSSFIYTPFDGKGDPATTIVCSEKKPIHAPGGKNELFADGHVEFKRTNAAGAGS